MTRPDPPEQVIRRWLDGHGGTVTVDVAALSRTWASDKLPRTERERIEGLLAAVGVRCAPPLRHRVEGQQITLFVREGGAVADPGAPDPYAGAMPVAEPPVEPVVEPEPEPVVEPEPEPVVEPEPEPVVEPEPVPEPEPGPPPDPEPPAVPARINLRRRPPAPVAPEPIEPEVEDVTPEPAPEPDTEVAPPAEPRRISLRRRPPEPVAPEPVEPEVEDVPPEPEPEPAPDTEVAPPAEPRRISLRRRPPEPVAPEPVEPEVEDVAPEPAPAPDTEVAPPAEPRRISLRRRRSPEPEPVTAIAVQPATAPAVADPPALATGEAEAIDEGFAPTEPVEKVAFYGVIAGIVAMLLGALGPWSKAFVTTSYGIDGAGLLVLGAGVTCFAGLALAREHRRVEPLFFIAAAAAASAGVAGSDLRDYVSDAAVSPAWGVWLAVLGSALAAVAALVLIVRREPEY